MRQITARQQRVIEIIQASIRERGYPPTLREIGKAMGIRSTNGVNDHIHALIRKGALVQEHDKARGLRLTGHIPVGPETPETIHTAGLVTVPVVSRIQRGLPLLHEPFLVDTVTLEASMVRPPRHVPGDYFGLKMFGNAMIQEGIVEGDYVFVRQQTGAMSGDLVVILVGDEAIVRRYFQTSTHIRLEPANKAMAPIYMLVADAKSARILGVVTAIFRRFG